MKKQTTVGLILAALFTALGVLFPMVFHAFGMGGPIFLPMHIPVLLCGLICGWRYGGLVGLIVPFLSSILTGMPPIYPVAVYMAIELITYGIVSGVLIKKYNTLVALIGAMLVGRMVLGIGQFVILGLSGKVFGLAGFLTSA
ncbi:MAG: ECF transporter S component, partial [Cellulosilyticaceae bacterium]